MKIDAGLAMVIAALVALLSALIVALINSRSQNNKVISNMDKQYSLVLYRLDQLEIKITASSSLEPKYIELAAKYDALEEQFKTLSQFVKQFVKQGGDTA